MNKYKETLGDRIVFTAIAVVAVALVPFYRLYLGVKLPLRTWWRRRR